MKVAVINSGSSSIKFKIFDMDSEKVIVDILVEEITNHHKALEDIISELEYQNIDFTSLDMIGHRVVHGGEEFCKSVVITSLVIDKIRELVPLAPLHNMANLDGILVCQKKVPHIKQIAVFDTAFHATMPKEAFLYALPYEMYDTYKIRRYGFHGTSHSYLLKKCALILDKEVSKLNIITLHLGNGASICAIKNGKSVDTSMGFTPLEGLIMGSRSGDIDSSIVLHLQRSLGFSIDEVDNILNTKSGLKGICDHSDVRDIVDSDNEKDKLALSMMIRRIKKYVGAYMTLLESIDAIVFSGGIGENSTYIREKVMDNNLACGVPILVIKTDEELEIVRECKSI
ncbi:acetate kinase [Sulfurimonas sp.]|uniref:acetate/propionate family kinase n=1 Tax=Sulfurimonas sp. TaxID=2022749 RepID=UPI002AB2192D|nr:acetate kinase [Sulfurimonas sp.]